MSGTTKRLVMVLAVFTTLFAVTGHAETPDQILASFATAAKKSGSDFQAFSVQRGRQFFNQVHGADWSCATCHSQNPLAHGKHVKTHKVIAPLAPAANAKRFTDTAKVRKWFRRNCNDVIGRECTPQEQGDVLAYLLSLQN